MNLDALKQVPWWGWAIAAVGAAGVVFLFWRSRRSGGGAAPAAGGPAGQQLPSTIDPLTGVPYQVESSINPQTGIPNYYGTPQTTGQTAGGIPPAPPPPGPGPAPVPKPIEVPRETAPQLAASAQPPSRGGRGGSAPQPQGSVIVSPWPEPDPTLYAIWQRHGGGLAWPVWERMVVDHPANRKGLGGSAPLYPWERIYLPQ